MEQAGNNINPLAAIFLATMSLLILGGSRQNAVRAILVTAAFIPLGQQIVLGGLHFYFLRILVLVGFVRLFSLRELAEVQLVGMDKLLICWVITGFVCGLLRGPSLETFGVVYDSLGVYFLLRALIRDANDVKAHLRMLACVAAAMAFCMLWETLTRRNLFHVLGGVPEVASYRNERFRAQGPFRHSILAGTFGATLLPLLVGLGFRDHRSKALGVVGVLACVVIIWASASSGPMMSLVAVIVGLGLWPMRDRMRLVRRAIVLAVLGCALMMKAPVWFLIGRLSELVGGTGWYRSFLIDAAIKHFDEWWLIGSSRTAHWSPWESNLLSFDQNNMDITNDYIFQGLTGGVLMLGLFVAIIVSCFKIIGRSVREQSNPEWNKWLVWGCGVALAAHCMAFVSVSYFDQIRVFWFWLLAVIGAVGIPEHSKNWIATLAAGTQDSTAESAALQD